MKISKFFSASVFQQWIPSAIMITLLCGISYTAVQQSLRTSADDPQVQITQDMSDLVATAPDPTAVINSAVKKKIDISKTLAIWGMIFDDSGKMLVSSGQLDGKELTIPKGVFDSTKKYGEDRFTFQPQKGVRHAVVMRHFGGSKPGFLMTARSLQAIEAREDTILQVVVFGWIVSLLVMYLVIAVLQLWEEKKEHHHTTHHS